MYFLYTYILGKQLFSVIISLLSKEYESILNHLEPSHE